jgi:hypothetical protein
MMNRNHKPNRWSDREPRRLEASVFAALLGACALSVAALFIQVITGAFDDDAQAMAAQQPGALVVQTASDQQP